MNYVLFSRFALSMVVFLPFIISITYVCLSRGSLHKAISTIAFFFFGFVLIFNCFIKTDSYKYKVKEKCYLKGGLKINNRYKRFDFDNFESKFYETEFREGEEEQSYVLITSRAYDFSLVPDFIENIFIAPVYVIYLNKSDLKLLTNYLEHNSYNNKDFTKL